MHDKPPTSRSPGRWAPLAFLLVFLLAGCAQDGSSGETRRLIEEYRGFLAVVGEDFDRLGAIDSKYPETMSNDAYLEYASEMAVQLQYAVDHLNMFMAFIQDNDRALREAGIDVQGARMMIEDQLTFYANTAFVIHSTLQEIQYEEEQKKALREELLETLPMARGA